MNFINTLALKTLLLQLWNVYLFIVVNFINIFALKTLILQRIMNRLIDLVGRVFTNCLGDLFSIPGHVIPKTFKMVLDTSLLNTQQNKVRIRGKVEQTRERSSAPPLYLPSGRPRLRSPTLLTTCLKWLWTLLIHWLVKRWYCNELWSIYLFKMIVNLINTLALKTLILQLNMKYLAV